MQSQHDRNGSPPKLEIGIHGSRIAANGWDTEPAGLYTGATGTMEDGIANGPPPIARRFFAQSSPWNTNAASKGTFYNVTNVSGTNWNAELDKNTSGRGGGPFIVGVTAANTHGHPTWFSVNGDVTKPGNCTANNGTCGHTPITFTNGSAIPVPAGFFAAADSDGHATIVSSNRRTDWEMWRCKHQTGASNGQQCTYDSVVNQYGQFDAASLVTWDLTGSEVAVTGPSAREAGVPHVNTSITGKEALYGIRHAVGLDVGDGISGFISPATNANVVSGSPHLCYGQLWALDPTYTIPSTAPVGVRHILQALKSYGGYIVDKGSTDLELNASNTPVDVTNFQAAGITSQSALTSYVTVDDFRLVKTSSTPTQPTTCGTP